MIKSKPVRLETVQHFGILYLDLPHGIIYSLVYLMVRCNLMNVSDYDALNGATFGKSLGLVFSIANIFLPFAFLT